MELLQHQLICFGLLILAHYGWSVCYFPGELQGTWATQTSTSQQSDQRGQRRAPITYSLIDVHADRISVWGQCHARLDNNIILSDRTRDSLCYRCFHFNVVSSNVVQVSSSGLDACYTSEAAATATCPTIYQIRSKQSREIMLYKRTTPWGENGVTQVECPLNGVYKFTYLRGTQNGVREARCDRGTSELSNCPYGFGLNIKYQDCSFSNMNTGLQCLGSWVGADEREYLTVWDPNVKDGDDKPMYKCGIYEEEAGTGNIYLAFSEDSTCFNGLRTPKDGHEMYKLMSVSSPALPPAVAQATCNFPRQLQGYWHHTYVSPDTIVFRDYRNFKTYSAKCVRDLEDNERYIVYARNHCGDWNYNCIWLKRRSANVLEFMMGLYPTENFDYSLCDPDKFGDMTSWTTQGKTLVEQPVMCPIVGTYTGELPDAPGFCAQLYSDCDSPDLMYYTVGDCRNNSSVYEQREYRCLGQWEEEGHLYALTYRPDIHSYECFVGKLKNNDQVVYIKEAGSSCTRGLLPEVLGMKMHRKDACTSSDRGDSLSTTNGNKAQASVGSPQGPPTKPPWLRTTKPWKPIFSNRNEKRSSSCKSLPSVSLLYSAVLLVFTLMHKIYSF